MQTRRTRRLLQVAGLVVLLVAVGLAVHTSTGQDAADSSPVARETFKAYWYAGKAELTRYALSQARYGELHKGDAVLIFVTEPFLTDKHVKHEYGDQANSTSVLKLNATKRFYTGIYPYSIMTSVFTPVDVTRRSTLKVTSSAQDWCGQTFMQVNARAGGYRAELRSYFQRAGDRDFELADALLEDEVWTRIRIAPSTLPTGQIKIIPGLEFARLGAFDLQVVNATATLASVRDGDLSDQPLQAYAIDYPELKRNLKITFERALPHRIVAWEETRLSGFGSAAKMLTTKAVRTNSLMIDYWSKNRPSDSHLRDELGLMY